MEDRSKVFDMESEESDLKVIIFFLSEVVVAIRKQEDNSEIHYVRGEPCTKYNGWSEKKWSEYMVYISRSLGDDEIPINVFCLESRKSEVEGMGASCSGFLCDEDFYSSNLFSLLSPFLSELEFKSCEALAEKSKVIEKDVCEKPEIIEIRASYTDDGVRRPECYECEFGVIEVVNNIFVKINLNSKPCNFSSSSIKESYGLSYFDSLNVGDCVDVRVDGLGVYWIAEKGI